MAKTQGGRVADANRGLMDAKDAHGGDSAEYRRALAVLQAVNRNSGYAARYYGLLEAATDPNGKGE